MRRRKFFLGGGAVLATAFAGCTDDTSADNGDAEDGDEDAESDETDVSETLDIVKPTVTDLRHPEPRAVSVDDEVLGGSQRQFSATVENTGMAGDIEMTLVLLEDLNTSVWSPFAEEAGTYQRFFSEGERRTEEFTAEWNEKYEAFGFRLLPTEAEVDVRNDGAGGEAEVRLLQQGGVGDGTVIESKSVELGNEATRTVMFNVDASFALEQDIDGIQLTAEAVSSDLSP